MVKQCAPIRVMSFILLAVSGALCQKNLPTDWLQGLAFDGSDLPEVQRPETDTSTWLPDAPSVVQSSWRGERFRAFGNEASVPLTLGGFGVSPGIIRETESGRVTPRPQANLTAHYQAAFIQERSGNLLGKDPHTSLFRQDLRYLPSTSITFMGRATYAASRILFTHDASGKGRPNTSYFLAVLASVASARPSRLTYWARSPSETFNNFGSTIGGDAGINLLHEFGPGIRQMVKGLTPKFVSRIEERTTHDLTRMGFASSPVR
jgi:hypothetical protein